MKLVIAIVVKEDRFTVNDELISEGYSVTRLKSKGGFLRKDNTTFLIGVSDEKVDHVIEIIKKTCKSRKSVMVPTTVGLEYSFLQASTPIEINVGGATVFIIDIEKSLNI